jgi:hypothetical protein
MVEIHFPIVELHKKWHEHWQGIPTWSGGQRLKLHFRSQGPASYF